jgi:ZIP family zinc transporter
MTWLRALLYGLLAGGALLLGAVIGIYSKPGRRVVALIMAFGAGVLLCALTFDLMEEAYRRGGFDSVTAGFLAGALLYVLGDWYVNGHGGHLRKYTLSKRHREYQRTKTRKQAPAIEPSDEGQAGGEAAGEGAGMAIFIGALLDGIPESAAIGVGLRAGKGFGLLMLIVCS